MNKYQTGCYHIHLFDLYGTKQRTLLAESLTEARQIATEQSIDGMSYAITRVLENSLDNRWKGQDVAIDDMVAAARQVV